MSPEQGVRCLSPVLAPPTPTRFPHPWGQRIRCKRRCSFPLAVKFFKKACLLPLKSTNLSERSGFVHMEGVSGLSL